MILSVVVVLCGSADLLTLFFRSDGERRHGVHAGQQQTRRERGDAGRPDDPERLLHRPVAGGRAEVLIRDPSSPAQGGWGGSTGWGDGRDHSGKHRDTNLTHTLTSITPDTEWAWPTPDSSPLLVISVVRSRLSLFSQNRLHPRTLQRQITKKHYF